jgi:hypothetical protein
MNADYFKQLSEPAAQPKKEDPAILEAKVQKYLAAGNAITAIPRGVTGVVLAPMGIKRTGFKGAQK